MVKKCETLDTGVHLDDMGPNLCNPKCPIGWIDIGKFCRKVNINVRDALFLYRKGDM